MTDQGLGPPSWEPLGYANPGMNLAGGKWQSGSVVFGVIAIVIGGCSGCLGVFTPLALLIPQPSNSAPAQSAGEIISGALLYLVVAGSLIWFGIGAIKMRRWVRPMALSVGTLILVAGICFTISMAVLWPTMMRISASQSGAARGASSMVPVVMGVTVGVMGFLAVVIPAAFMWFYRKQEVKAALEHFDPTARWTDDRPIPVLVVVMALGLYAGLLVVAIPQAIMPAFGTVFHGLPAMMMEAVVAAVALVLARMSYRRRPSGWWGTVIFLVVVTVAYMMTGLRSDQADLYQAAGYNPLQVDAIRQIRSAHPIGTLALPLPIWLLTIGYMVYVRKYFDGGEAREIS